MEYDYDMHERIRFYLPENKAGTSVKLEWAEDHDFMFIYTDRSLSYNKGIRRTGFGVIVYRNSREIASEKGPMGEHVEADETEMRASRRPRR